MSIENKNLKKNIFHKPAKKASKSISHYNIKESDYQTYDLKKKDACPTCRTHNKSFN